MSKLSMLYSVLLLVAIPFFAEAKSSETVLVGFISRESADFYEKVAKPYWQKLSSGSSVELVSLTTFDSKGRIDLERLAENIQRAPASMKSIYVQWNEKYEPTHGEWLTELRKKTATGTRVAFFAGMAQPGLKRVPLSQTLAAQVPKALILGELVERERLSPHHFYGPELFSAFQAKGQRPGLAPLAFVGRWASHGGAQDLDQSLYELRRKRMKSLRIWPTTEDFFGN